ncbi:hypothetical protein BACI349Y_430008 [Bacillus sp. 349Y]|nr:hypothetical protein BACI349Y_430008 [Bacillus sp. 349Y]
MTILEILDRFVNRDFGMISALYYDAFLHGKLPVLKRLLLLICPSLLEQGYILNM